MQHKKSVWVTASHGRRSGPDWSGACEGPRSNHRPAHRSSFVMLAGCWTSSVLDNVMANPVHHHRLDIKLSAYSSYPFVACASQSHLSSLHQPVTHSWEIIGDAVDAKKKVSVGRRLTLHLAHRDFPSSCTLMQAKRRFLDYRCMRRHPLRASPLFLCTYHPRSAARFPMSRCIKSDSGPP